MSSMTHQQWTDELVAQVEDWQGEGTPVIELYLDEADKITELVFANVQLKDGIIECKLAVF